MIFKIQLGGKVYPRPTTNPEMQPHSFDAYRIHITMKTKQTIAQSIQLAAVTVLTALGLTTTAKAATITKADNADNLNLTTSWVGGVVPGASDVATWDSTVSVNNTTNVLGANLSLGGVKILNPAGAINIDTNSGGNVLTLGASGIDMSAAAADLTMSNNVTLLGNTVQAWNVPAARTLSLQGGLTRSAGGFLNINGDGVINIGTGTISTALYYSLLNGTDVGALDGSLNVTGVATAIGYSQNTPGGAPSSSYLDVVNSASGVGGLNGSGDDVYLNSTIYFPGVMRFNTPQANRNYWYYNVRNGQNSMGAGATATVLVTTNVGACDVIISGVSHAFRWASGGTSSGAELIIDQENTLGTLFINGAMSQKAAAPANMITKRGAGRVVFNASLVTTGPTRILEGNLMVNNSSVNGSPFIINSGATLSGAGIAWGPVTNSGTIWAGNTNGLGSFIVNTAVMNAGSSLKFYSPTAPTTNTSALLNLTNVTINGGVGVIIASGGIAVGQYPLVHWTNSFSGATFANFTLAGMPPHSSGYLSNNTANFTIDLVVTNVTRPLDWAAASGVWDINNNPNWKDSAGTTTTYQEANGVGDAVVFEDTQSGASPITVTLNTTLKPSSLVVNSSKNYTLSGSGKIAGSCGLTVSGSGTLTLGTGNSYSGQTTLNGGTTVFSALSSLGSGAISFGGGKLQYNGNTDDLSLRSVTFASGQSTIDIGAGTVTFANPVGNNGAGGFTKAGSGTLTLTGTNKYSGNTVISQGTLALAANTYISNSAAIIVNSGATLDTWSSGAGLSLVSGAGQILGGSGTVSGTVISSNGVITPGTNGVVGTLTFANDLTLAGGTVNLDLSTDTAQSDLVVVSGNLNTYGGTVQLNVTGTLTNGIYKLIQCGSLVSGSGSAANLTLAGYTQAGKSLALSDAGSTEIDLVVTPAASDNIVWTGTDGASWDLISTLNWQNGATQWAYTNGDFVTFDEIGIGLGSANVALKAAVTPSSVVVSNETATYTFSDGTGTGGGKISGGTSIVKKGPGKLVVATANNNSGPTDLQNGTLQIGDGGTFGNLGAGNVTNNGVLIFNQSDDHTVSGVISGSGSVSQQGVGTVTLLANNTYAGPTTISSGGTLQVGTGGAAGSLGTGAITNDGTLIYNKSGTLTVGSIKSGPAIGGALTFSGSATVTLNNGNTYVNNTTIDGGVLKVAAADSIPSAATVTGSTGWLVLDGGAIAAGTLDLNGFNITVNALSGLNNTVNGTVLNSSTGHTNTLTINGTSTTTFSGTIKDNAGAGGGIAVFVGGGANQTFDIESAAGNSYTGGTVISNATVTLTSAIANNNASYPTPIGLGSGTVTLLSNAMLYAVGAPSQSSGPTWSSLSNTISIPAGQTATIYGPQRGAMLGKITGAGTLNYITSYVRGSISGDWSGFTGQIIFSGSANGNNLGIANAAGMGSSRVLCTNAGAGPVTLYNTVSGTPTIAIGELADDGTAYLESTTSGGGGGVAANFAVGGLNTTATYGGAIIDNIGIIKVGTGTWNLTGATLTYSGLTTVSNGVLALGASATLPNTTPITLVSPGALDVSAAGTLNLAAQTLQGNGTLLGSLSTTADSVVSPGGAGSIGTLTVTNDANLTGTNIMELNIANSPATNDMLVAQTIEMGGTLTVTNIGPDLHTGDTFKLFSVPATGEFTVTNLPATTADGSITYVWDNKLAIDGTLVLLQGAPPIATYPTNITATVNGSSLQITWPATHLGWMIQVQTNNLSSGLSTNWVTISNTASVLGYTNTMNPANGSVFYRLRKP